MPRGSASRRWMHWHRPGLTAEKFVARPSVSGLVCTGQGIWSDGTAKGSSSFMVASTDRSRSQAGGSNRARSKRRFAKVRPGRRRRRRTRRSAGTDWSRRVRGTRRRGIAYARGATDRAPAAAAPGGSALAVRHSAGSASPAQPEGGPSRVGELGAEAARGAFRPEALQ